MKPILLILIACCISQILSAQSMRPAMSSHVPATGALSVPVYIPLSISFNKMVTKGFGNIYVHNRSQSAAIMVPVSSPNVTIADSTVYVTGLYLDPEAYYHITFDSAAFSSGAYNSFGLYDTSAWWFRTAGSAAGLASPENTTLSLALVSPATHGRFTLRCCLPAEGLIDAMVYDLAGRVVAHQFFTGITGANILRFQTAASTGTYFIQITYGKQRSIIRCFMG